MGVDVVILGAGESGVGAALLAQKEGLSVFVSDLSEIKNQYKAELINAKIPFEEKMHSSDTILSASLVVKSPGIPDTAPLIIKLIAQHTPVISEIEFAAKYTTAKFVCITGSNGKTTTTLLIHHVLKQAGIKVGLAGNIGQSLARQVATGANVDWYILELSSFQLDGMYDFRADIAILLNITPDHLDRYDYKMENYIDSKFRVLQNQTTNDHFIYCYNDDIITSKLKGVQAQANQHPFSYNKHVDNGAYSINDVMCFETETGSFEIPFGDLTIKGQHNCYNAMAAGIVANIFNIDKANIQESLSSFKGVEHRLERVTSIDGITYINDSKATNIDSAWYALGSIDTSVVWIAGGVDKGNDYSQIKLLASAKVKALVCLGLDNEKLFKEFSGFIPTIVEVHSMEDAVKKASDIAANGDTVLLSPACASFDLFDNYEQRGRLFKECVQNL